MVCDSITIDHAPNEVMKLGLLVTDNDVNYGGEQGIANSIKTRLHQVIPKELLEIVTYFVVNGDLPTNVNQFHGFIITGSHFSVNDELEWMLQLETIARNIHNTPNGPKLFGICFGHQLIAKALGGKIGRNPNGKFIWCSGAVEVQDELSEKSFYKKVFGYSTCFHIMQSHYEQILELPICGKNVGKAPGECDHEVVMYGNNILTMQGHPEVTVDRMKDFSLPLLKASNKLTAEGESEALKSFEKESGNDLINMMYEFFKS